MPRPTGIVKHCLRVFSVLIVVGCSEKKDDQQAPIYSCNLYSLATSQTVEEGRIAFGYCKEFIDPGFEPQKKSIVKTTEAVTAFTDDWKVTRKGECEAQSGIWAEAACDRSAGLGLCDQGSDPDVPDIRIIDVILGYPVPAEGTTVDQSALSEYCTNASTGLGGNTFTSGV